MALAPGTRLGVYEITALLGEGGMGQVYRATDTRLKRQVAIKSLPPAVAADADRLPRFQREAEVLAALNHPHIAAIYGFEESGGVSALVMELVEGEDLSQRLARGAIPLDEVIPLAAQMADALEAAHDQGIIHRDLKPANIKVRSDGTVKVLDFGLAKALAPTGASDAAAAGAAAATITSPAMTQAGMILGTAAYMSPEQAKGRAADKRSDVWAFGCVLYEMLSGQRAFKGEDVADTLALVLRGEPDMSALPAGLPRAVDDLIRGCLRKHRAERVGDIAAARFVLKGVSHPSTHESESAKVSKADADAAVTAAVRSQAGSYRRRLLVVALSALVVGLSVAAIVSRQLTRSPRAEVVRLTISTPEPVALSPTGTDRDIAITPDGSHVVYRGNNQLLVRALADLDLRPLTGLGTPRGPFTSPDGQWVGFFDGNNLLKKVAIAGGPPVTISEVDGGGPRGATWGPDGTIVFATNLTATGLQRVPFAGGTAVSLTTPDRQNGEGDHLWPEFLPGGNAVLFTVAPTNLSFEDARIAVFDLATGTAKTLIRGGSHAHYVVSGHLVYSVAGTLRAVPFDLDRLELAGTPVPVLNGLATSEFGAAQFAVAANGSLVYAAGAAGGNLVTVVSLDRQGRAEPLPGLPADTYRDLRLSPDGGRLALSTTAEVWIYDFANGIRSALTTNHSRSRYPLWTPDGERVVFTSYHAGYPELFWRRADGTGSEDLLLSRAKDLLGFRATGWSPDGRQLLFSETVSDLRSSIGQVAVDALSEVTVLLKSGSRHDSATVSPDGRWIAYDANISGRSEVYLERYPGLGNRQQVSADGGTRPMWSRDGRELFFGSLDSRRMLAVDVHDDVARAAARPRMLFEFGMAPIVAGNRPYDVAADGHFVVIPAGQSAAPQMVVVQHWFEELRRFVPVAK